MTDDTLTEVGRAGWRQRPGPSVPVPTLTEVLDLAAGITSLPAAAQAAAATEAPALPWESTLAQLLPQIERLFEQRLQAALRLALEQVLTQALAQARTQASEQVVGQIAEQTRAEFGAAVRESAAALAQEMQDPVST